MGEGRHALGRSIFFGRLGELRHAYREGMEDQLGALGMALNAVVWWNILYVDAAVKQLEAGGLAILPEIRSRFSPLVHEHINSAAAPPSSARTATEPCARCAT
ncbi:Tn3 family transposase [Streptomyces olivoreticuli]